MTKAEFLNQELKAGRCWKAYYSDVYQCGDSACKAKIKIQRKQLGNNVFNLQVEIKGSHVQHNSDVYKTLIHKKLKWGINLFDSKI